MDVHKEAIVIAVLNGSGKLIMGTIVETKAGSSLQSAPQCLVKGWEQERQSGCAQAGRVAAERNAATGLPRRKWTADAARVGAQLSDHQPRFNQGDESAEGTVSRLGANERNSLWLLNLSPLRLPGNRS
jgi:hypothetical protein